jgi:hypothetical protein
MKSDLIHLAEWKVYEHEEYVEYVDIPWPKIHQLVGNEQIRWIQSQDPTRCQLILDSTLNGLRKLYAEFYDPLLRVEYALRFAK